MTPKKIHFLLIGVLVLLIILICGATYQGNAFFVKQSQKITDLKVEAEAIEMQQNALIQAKKDIEKYSELESIAKTVVPQDKDQAKTVREIIQIANDNDIPIKSVVFDSSTLGDAKPRGGSSQQSQSQISQAKPVEGINGVYALPIQIDSSEEVAYPNFLKFLGSLEKNRRTAHVDTINVTPNEIGSALEFSLTLNAYVKP